MAQAAALRYLAGGPNPAVRDVSYQIPDEGRAFDVTGLGNALVDALVRVEDESLLSDGVLAELNLKRGHMHPVDHKTWEAAYHKLLHLGVEIQSGGSCANTVSTLGLLGMNAIYCGQVGDDDLGNLYIERITEACGQHAVHRTLDMPTGKCLSIISGKDAERTMLTDLGAAVALPGLGGFDAAIQGSRLFHVTGYLLLGEPMRTRAIEAITAARAAGVPVSIDAADPFVIETIGGLMWEVVEQYADIVFLNAEEAAVLCGTSPEDALPKVAGICETVAIKLGSRGSLVSHRGEVVRAGVHKVRALDTTGAGDSYAAGFLYGLLKGWPAARAADLGSRVAALTVSQVGAVVRDRAKLAAAVQAAREQE